MDLPLENKKGTPVLECIIDNGLKEKAVSNLRWASKMEHFNCLQSGVSMAQSARKETEASIFGI